MNHKLHLSPFAMPILFFGTVILAGALLLHSPFSVHHQPISWIDAVFTATSATCVTGLAVVDTGSFFTRSGQLVILGLIQLGGLGIMTYTSLVFYLWRRRVSLNDRVAVGQNLLHDPTFKLGHFLVQLLIWTLLIEMAGALLLFAQAPRDIGLYSAFFHAVSAFCNAGFSIYADSFMAWRGDWGINLVIMLLIIMGGIGFSVMLELKAYIGARLLKIAPNGQSPARLSWYAAIVLRTSLFLVIAGAAAIFLAEFIGFHRHLSSNEAVLSALFQSVTCRTAGFNTLDIGRMTNVSLTLMIVLMFIGGASGSCAGGVKISTFRATVAFITAQISGRRQAVVGKFAVDYDTLNKALSLIIFAGVIIFTATMALNVTEGGDVPHPQVRGAFLDLLFEVVSAFGTVGLSTGLTPHLSSVGKSVIILVMFIGRLGPILFLSALQSLQEKKCFAWPEESMLIG